MTSYQIPGITQIGERAVSVFAGAKEELETITTDFSTTLGLGQTLQVMVATAGIASHLADFSGNGSGSNIVANVLLNKRFGDAMYLTDEQLANMSKAKQDFLNLQVTAGIRASIANAHSLVTSANFPLVTGIAAKAGSAWTFADFQANVNAVVGLNKLNTSKLTFIATSKTFNMILAGLTATNIAAGSNSIAQAIIGANSFDYLGVHIVKSDNLPSTITAGYFTDTTGVVVGFGVDKYDGNASNGPSVETFADADSGLGYTIRSYYSNDAGSYKIIPYVITGAAVGNANGIIIPSLT